MNFLENDRDSYPISLNVAKTGCGGRRMKNADDSGKDLAALDELIEEITVDAYGDDEQLWSFRQVMEDEISLPCDGIVIGEPVAVLEIDYDGNERRGLTATCRRMDGTRHIVAATDVVFPRQSKGYRYLACYRKWLGLDPFPSESASAYRERRRRKKDTGLGQEDSVELVVLSVKQQSARCRLLKSDLIVTVRTGRTWDMIPGEIITVRQGKRWNFAGHTYLSGKIDPARLEAAALGLVPLKLENVGTWTPEEHYWGEEDEPVEEWAKPIIAYGARPSFEMEQVLPGMEPDDFDDPICRSNDLKNAGDPEAAFKILMELCQEDLRCLDAHAHLGNFVFDHNPDVAIRHYEVGLRIGELSLEPDFNGLLPWGFVNNRPFLRCMHGYGICLWRLGRFTEAARNFERMLWLNPSDNQGVRFLIDNVKDRVTWEKCQKDY